MKINVLKENEPLEVIKVIKHRVFQPFGLDTKENIEFDTEKVKMKILTDGEIERESDIVSKKIDNYTYKQGMRKYQYDATDMITKNIYFKNHSFVITYLIANEYMHVGNIYGNFDVIKDISIYLENPKDKEALKKAKKVIRQINHFNSSQDYSSLFGVILSRTDEELSFDSKKISEDIYHLSKKRTR